LTVHYTRSTDEVTMSDIRTEVRLSREMRLLDVTMIGVGAMIGAGIFVLTGIAAGVAGPALIVAFFLNGFVSLLTALVYAELGSCFHDAGGGYLWVKKGLPDPNGFLSGWMSWFAHAVACSLYALGFGAYFALVLKMLGIEGGHDWPVSLEKILAVVAVVVFCVINFRGASEAGKAGNLVTAAKLLVLAVFLGFGMAVMWRNPDWTTHFQGFLAKGWGGVFMAMGLTFIAFEGYEIIAQCSEEVENPKRNIPRAVFISLAVVIPIYLLVAWVAVGAIDGHGVPAWQYLASHKETAMVEAARQFFSGGGLMILVGGLLSTVSALNATIYSSSRVAFAMARDHNLPTAFAGLSRTHKTPHVAIFFSMLIIIAMLLWLPIEDVASAADVMFLLLFLQVNLAVIAIRRKMPHLDRGFSVPLFPLVPIMAIAGNVFIAGWLFKYSPKAWLSAGAWIVAGFVLHRFYAAPKEEAALEQAARIEKIERKDYRVLVALASPHTARSLIEFGVAVARRHGGEIVCLAVAEVPEGKPLVAGLDDTARLTPLIEDAVKVAREAGLTARGLIKVSHRISHGIAETVHEEECNFLVMGRRRRPSVVQWLFTSTLDAMAKEAPCDVAIVAGLVRHGVVRRVLVPVDDGRNARLACELAPAIATWCDADIRPITVLPQLATQEATQQRRRSIESMIQSAGLEERLTVLRQDDIVDAIRQASESGDLILLGASSSGTVAELMAASAPRRLIERGTAPVVAVRKYEPGRGGWLESVLNVR
jgi:amino acid transporter/nucleotide-binding universal stress UspA family protein